MLPLKDWREIKNIADTREKRKGKYEDNMKKKRRLCMRRKRKRKRWRKKNRNVR